MVDNSQIQDMYPAYLDDNRLLYSTWRSRSDRHDDIAWVDLTNGQSQLVGFNSDVDDSDPSAIRGQMIGYSSNTAGNYDIYLGDLTTGTSMVLSASDPAKQDLGGTYADIIVRCEDDNDGIPTLEEKGPNGNDPGYDGNGDGIPDSQQANVASFHAFTGGYVTLASSEGLALSDVAAANNPSPADMPGGVKTPYGFFDFKVPNLRAGGHVVVDIYVPDGSIVNSYYKYGPTPGNTTPHWYEFNFDGTTGAVIERNVIHLHFVDGLRGDDDLTANGVIVEPGAPAFMDKTPPAPPVIAGITDDTGTPGDGITSDKTLVINGTAEASSTVELFVSGSSIGTTTANASGSWSLDYTGTSLADGTYALTATATDEASNTSAISAAFTVVVDTAAPASPVVIGIAEDTGTPGDGIIRDNTLVVGGTAEANSTVTVQKDSSSIGTTTANGLGAWSFDYTGTILADGTYGFTATATDAAGNTSGASTVFTVRVDTGVVSAPVIAGIADDTGTPGHGITSDNTLVVSGTAEAYSTVRVYKNGGSIGTTPANGSGAWSYDYTGTTLADGTYSFTATATDAAGNTSPTSAAFTVVVDTAAPAAPAVSGITTDTGTAGDGITNDNTLVISGRAEANSTVTVYKDSSSIGTSVTNSFGAWSFDYTGTVLADGTYSFTATATDAAGNTSAVSAALIVKVDTAAPASPVVIGITDDTGTPGDGITSDKALVISGTAEANSTVTVYKDSSSIGTTTANGSGVWAFDYRGTSLADGTYALTARAMDPAGNTSVVSAGFTVRVDTVAPVVTVNALTTADTTPQLTGTVNDPSAVVQLTVANKTYTATNNGNGTWTLADNTINPALAIGTYDVLARAADAAGNTGTDAGTGKLIIQSQQGAVDSLVRTALGSTRYDLRTGQTSIQMTIKNTSQTVILGPLWVVIKSISDPKVTLAGSSGVTADGYLYIDVSSLFSNGRLDPGQSVSVWLSFNNPLRRRFDFSYSIRGVV